MRMYVDGKSVGHAPVSASPEATANAMVVGAVLGGGGRGGASRGGASTGVGAGGLAAGVSVGADIGASAHSVGTVAGLCWHQHALAPQYVVALAKVGLRSDLEVQLQAASHYCFRLVTLLHTLASTGATLDGAEMGAGAGTGASAGAGAGSKDRVLGRMCTGAWAGRLVALLKVSGAAPQRVLVRLLGRIMAATPPAGLAPPIPSAGPSASSTPTATPKTLNAPSALQGGGASVAAALRQAKVCGWGVYCCDFLLLSLAPSVSCSCLDAQHTPSSKLALSSTVSRFLQPV